MISTYDFQQLDGILKDFHTAVGIRISIFDDEFNPVTEYPKTAPAFCRCIRESAAGKEGCKKCDRDACLRAAKLRAPHIYVCHAGITEAIMPIQLGGGVLGYAILAHMLPKENLDDAVENACAIAEKYGVAHEKSRAALGEISVKTEDEIRAAATLLDAMSSYVNLKNLARWKDEDVSFEIDGYIKSDLSLPPTCDDICKRFNCSRTALYNLSMRAFGMGIMQYVMYCRIEHAKKLLSAGKSIADTASECGFSEYNYFCKVFRRHTGLSPGGYKSKTVKSGGAKSPAIRSD